ncbi:right-handed parallel beta-helix repeat-containing protein [Ereboglobus luteus]|uniref:Right handed beta helix domain-containing protein n=1 Tax=Ereboglobus luteus TaxID=1796921 RepID=A0A2U8E4K4_9BACT|nr:right-handed parallel beta-helix repeat-containing protein [Ereboglobus luteus]AWI09452.1 hypothetical protein CKA38_09520 [Ereboglobus luteus]
MNRSRFVLFLLFVFTALSATAAPNAPKLLTPKHNEVSLNATPVFSWAASPGAVAYEIEVSADYDFKTIVVPRTRVEGTSFTPAKPLHRTNRFWHVRAIDSAGNPGKWSSAYIYRLQPEPKTSAPAKAPASATPAASAVKESKTLKLLTPKHNEESTNATPVFTWTPVTGAVAYEIEIAADYEYKKTVVPVTRVDSPSFTPAEPLYPSNRFWRVRTIDASGKAGKWAGTFVYKLKPAPASQARAMTKRPAVYPANNQTGIVQNPSFTWDAVPGAVAYEIEIAADFTYKKTVVPVTRVETPRYVPMQALYPSARFWRTRAIQANGRAGEWSGTRVYKLHAPANKINIPANATLAEIRAAIDAAPASSLITFAPNATYRLKMNQKDSHFLTLSKRDDLIIDGNNSLFIIDNPSAGAFNMRECQRITVRRFRFDYDPLPHSVGVVESFNPGEGAAATVTLRSLPGYPDFDAPHMIANWSWGVILDPVITGRMKAKAPLVMNFPGAKVSRNAAGPNLFDVAVPHVNYGKFFSKGDRVVIFSRERGRSLCSAEMNCDDITFDRVTTHASPAGHFIAVNCSDVKILACASSPKDASRVYAGNADGAHVRANLLGPWIEGCTFDSIGDDGIALYNKGMAINARPANDTLTVAGTFMNLQPGDAFVIFNPFDGSLVGETRTVTAVKPAGGGAHNVTFKPALATKDDFPAGDKTWWKNAQLFNRTRQNSGFVIKNNTFKSVRRYSVIVRSTDGIIVDNDITGSSNSAITLLNEPHSWANGLHSERVLIARNKISASTVDGSASSGGSIAVNLRNLNTPSVDAKAVGKASTKPARLHRDIRIENNTITDWNYHAILLRSATGCTVTGNVISAPAGAKFIAPEKENIAILVDNTDGCVISGNDTSGDPRLGSPEQRLTVIDSDNATVKNNKP